MVILTIQSGMLLLNLWSHCLMTSGKAPTSITNHVTLITKIFTLYNCKSTCIDDQFLLVGLLFQPIVLVNLIQVHTGNKCHNVDLFSCKMITSIWYTKLSILIYKVILLLIWQMVWHLHPLPMPNGKVLFMFHSIVLFY